MVKTPFEREYLNESEDTNSPSSERYARTVLVRRQLTLLGRRLTAERDRLELVEPDPSVSRRGPMQARGV